MNQKSVEDLLKFTLDNVSADTSALLPTGMKVSGSSSRIENFIKYPMPHPDNFQYIPRPGNGYVYHITSGRKHYIGISTTPFSRRWERHKAPDSGCTKLVKELNRLRATGQWANLNVQVLQQARNQKLDRLQKKYIKKYASYKSIFGLNSTPGGRQMTPAKMHMQKLFKRTKKKLKISKPVFTWQQV